LLQEGKQEPENVLAVATAKYKTSQTRTAVDKAVKEVLHQDDGNDIKLGNMVESIILSNLMCECHLLWYSNLCLLVPFSKGLTGRRKNVTKGDSIDAREPIVQVDETWSLHFVHLIAASIVMGVRQRCNSILCSIALFVYHLIQAEQTICECWAGAAGKLWSSDIGTI